MKKIIISLCIGLAIMAVMITAVETIETVKLFYYTIVAFGFAMVSLLAYMTLTDREEAKQKTNDQW